MGGGLSPTLAQSRWRSYLNTNLAYVLALDGPRVWCGTGGGVKVYQRETGRWRILTPAEGVPGNQVRALAIRGTQVWVGVAEGRVGWYDKDKNEWHLLPEELPSAPIQALALDGDTVWVGTAGGGVACYDPLTETWTTYTTAEGLGSDWVYALCVERSGVWAGTRAGLSKFDRPTREWITYRPENSPLSGRINALLMVQGRLWVASERNGLAVIDVASAKMSSYEVTLGDGRLYALATEGNWVWLGTGRGLIEVRLDREEWQLLPDTAWHITALAASPQELWVGTRRAGVRCYDRQRRVWSEHRSRHGLPLNDLSCLALDQNAIWLGSRSEGVARLTWDTQEWHHFTAEQGLTADQVRDLVAVRGSVWCATPHGLSHYDAATERWQQYTMASTGGRLIADDLTSILLHDGRLWFAGEGGVSVCDLAMKEWKTWELEGTHSDGYFPRLVSDVYTGDVWVIFPREVYRYCIREGEWYLYRKPFRPVTMGTYDPAQQFILDVAIDLPSAWFACVDGLRQYDKQMRSWYIHDDRTAAPLREVTVVSPGRGAVWVGVTGYLCRFDRALRQWKAIPLPEPLRSERITALAVDGTKVWVATAEGIGRYQDEEKTWTTFGLSSGIVSGIHTIRVTADQVWFVGTNGLSVYHKE